MGTSAVFAAPRMQNKGCGLGADRMASVAILPGPDWPAAPPDWIGYLCAKDTWTGSNVEWGA